MLKTTPSESPLRPCDVTLTDFCNSPFGNRQTEQVLRRILVLQMKKNTERWEHFTAEEYFCFFGKSLSSSAEKFILDALVTGGNPLPYSTCKSLPSGYLTKHGIYYNVEEPLLTFFAQYRKKEAGIKAA